MNLLFLTFIPLNFVGENQAITWMEKLWEKIVFFNKLFPVASSHSQKTKETINLRPSDISVPMFSMALKMFLYVISGLHVELPFEDLINAESSSRSVPVAKL